MNAAQTLFDSIFMNGLVMSMLPLGPFRRLVCYPLSTYHRMKVKRALNEILPVVQERCEKAEGRNRTDTGDEDASQLDAIDWSIDLTRTHKKECRPECIAITILHTIWAGSPPSAGLLTQMVFQVLLEPRYIEPLRSEAETAFGTHGFTDTALRTMPLMDSFIRELNRLYPTGAVTCARTIEEAQGFRFHDGLQLSAGTRIAVPALAIQTDPDNFHDPLTFDGFRFARQRAAESGGATENVPQKQGAATTSEVNLA